MQNNIHPDINPKSVSFDFPIEDKPQSSPAVKQQIEVLQQKLREEYAEKLSQKRRHNCLR